MFVGIRDFLRSYIFIPYNPPPSFRAAYLTNHPYFLTLYLWWHANMMTSSNENIFRVTGPLWGESTSDRWIPLTKARDAELWCFLWSAPKKRLRKHSRHRRTPYDATDQRPNKIYIHRYGIYDKNTETVVVCKRWILNNSLHASTMNMWINTVNSLI